MRLSLLGSNLLSVSMLQAITCDMNIKYLTRAALLRNCIVKPDGVSGKRRGVSGKRRGSAASQKRAAKKRNNIRKHK